MNCFALNPLPPKYHVKFFREQIELRVAPCLIDPWNFQMFFLQFKNPGDLCPQPSVTCFDFFQKGIAHRPSPCEQVTSPAELSSIRKKISVNTNPNKNNPKQQKYKKTKKMQNKRKKKRTRKNKDKKVQSQATINNDK